MAGTTLDNLGLIYDWTLGSFYKDDMDSNLIKLDSTVQLAVIDRDLTAPPGSPVDGNIYIPAATATGAWAGHEDDVSVWYDGSWLFYTPLEGWVARIKDEDISVIFDGSSWAHLQSGKNINAQTGTSYTLTNSDNEKIVTLTNGSAITLTVPQTSTEAIKEGFQCTLIQRGAGQVSVATEGSDTLEAKSSHTKISAQYGSVTITKLVDGSPNVWHMSGDTAA